MARTALVASVLLVVISGCSTPSLNSWQGVPAPGAAFVPGQNPVFLPVSDHEFLWNQIVDAVDDHFRIDREQRMQHLAGGVITEGTIETFPTTGSTIFEPWRGDSTWGFQRWYATLQPIRRQASVRVSPGPNGYQVALVVMTELEDMGRPEGATAGAMLMRPEGPVGRDRARRYTASSTIGWIPMGRDTSLEQKILEDIRARVSSAIPLTQPVGPPAP